MKKYLIAFALMALSASISHAGILFEPAVTYEFGDNKVTYPQPINSSTGTVRGLGFGVRVAYELADIVFVGLDGRYSMPQFKDSSVNYDASSVATNWGPVVGMQMPILGLRVWAGYIAGAEMNPDQSGSFDVKFTEGKGYRIGGGFHFILVSLNLEYQQIKYDKTTFEQFGPFSAGSPTSDVTAENKSWLISASFPLNF